MVLPVLVGATGADGVAGPPGPPGAGGPGGGISSTESYLVEGIQAGIVTVTGSSHFPQFENSFLWG